jgi:hypothetical protein
MDLAFPSKRFFFWLLLLVPFSIATASHMAIHLVMLLGLGTTLAYFANSMASAWLRDFAWAINLALVVAIAGYSVWTKLGWASYVSSIIR